MRKVILGLLLSICCVFHAEAQAPEWVTQRPTSSDAYIGIGVASLSDNDYIKGLNPHRSVCLYPDTS